MFNNLFTQSAAIARYESAPMLEERLRYLKHCEAGGARRSTLQELAADQLLLIRLLHLKSGDRVDIKQVKAAIKEWSRTRSRSCSADAAANRRRRFLGRAVRWLNFEGCLDQPPAARHPHADLVAAFAGWMRDERGLSEGTIDVRCRAADGFFVWLVGQRRALASVGISDIDRALAAKRAQGCSRTTIMNHADQLRAFFKFAERNGWCRPGIAAGIMPARTYPDDMLPMGVNREDVLRLLATTEGGRAVDVRDRAILMLIVTYGLRAGEVGGLQLDDLDWEREVLRVRCRKPGRTLVHPLSRGVGHAVTRYLREVRPRRQERNVFLTLCAPYVPLASTTIWHVVAKRMRRIGIGGRRRGPHALRHACAQHLLDKGLSMKEIGDYLGHRSVSATAVYARVKVDALREVADVDLEGLL